MSRPGCFDCACASASNVRFSPICDLRNVRLAVVWAILLADTAPDEAEARWQLSGQLRRAASESTTQSGRPRAMHRSQSNRSERWRVGQERLVRTKAKEKWNLRVQSMHARLHNYLILLIIPSSPSSARRRDGGGPSGPYIRAAEGSRNPAAELGASGVQTGIGGVSVPGGYAVGATASCRRKAAKARRA